MIIFLKKLNNFMYYEEKDIITQDGFLEFCEKNKICFLRPDYFYLNKQIHLWRGVPHPTKINDIVVMGHSDYSITDEISNEFKLVFCINRDTGNTNTFGLPLGITSDCDDSPIHRIYGNKSIMFDVINEKLEKTNLLYLNFSINTYADLRQSVYNKFVNESWVNVGTPEHTINGRKKYLREIKSSKFVLCPRGNGIDTHRIWESLYMGSIPIVIYENTHHLFTDLPILFINDWEEITYDLLNDKYEEINNQTWNYDKLKIDYWEKFITEKISQNI
jgi:hypothetical protein